MAGWGGLLPIQLPRKHALGVATAAAASTTANAARRGVHARALLGLALTPRWLGPASSTSASCASASSAASLARRFLLIDRSASLSRLWLALSAALPASLAAVSSAIYTRRAASSPPCAGVGFGGDEAGVVYWPRTMPDERRSCMVRMAESVLSRAAAAAAPMKLHCIRASAAAELREASTRPRASSKAPRAENKGEKVVHVHVRRGEVGILGRRHAGGEDAERRDDSSEAGEGAQGGSVEDQSERAPCASLERASRLRSCGSTGTHIATTLMSALSEPFLPGARENGAQGGVARVEEDLGSPAGGREHDGGRQRGFSAGAAGGALSVRAESDYRRQALGGGDATAERHRGKGGDELAGLHAKQDSVRECREEGRALDGKALDDVEPRRELELIAHARVDERRGVHALHEARRSERKVELALEEASAADHGRGSGGGGKGGAGTGTGAPGTTTGKGGTGTNTSADGALTAMRRENSTSVLHVAFRNTAIGVSRAERTGRTRTADIPEHQPQGAGAATAGRLEVGQRLISRGRRRLGAPGGEVVEKDLANRAGEEVETANLLNARAGPGEEHERGVQVVEGDGRPGDGRAEEKRSDAEGEAGVGELRVTAASNSWLRGERTLRAKRESASYELLQRAIHNCRVIKGTQTATTSARGQLHGARADPILSQSDQNCVNRVVPPDLFATGRVDQRALQLGLGIGEGLCEAWAVLNMTGHSLEMVCGVAWWRCTTVPAQSRKHAVHLATRPPTRGYGRAGEVPHRTRPKRAQTSASHAWAAMRQLGQGRHDAGEINKRSRACWAIDPRRCHRPLPRAPSERLVAEVSSWTWPLNLTGRLDLAAGGRAPRTSSTLSADLTTLSGVIWTGHGRSPGRGRVATRGSSPFGASTRRIRVHDGVVSRARRAIEHFPTLRQHCARRRLRRDLGTPKAQS
ncbi:hypothetical protein T492DRAFT_834658 [Pavlovales sp. CCMP2436]|nr:hypothetical protein T492DRAFT_834658 [Pavlovales sp. CCMP2436]